MSILKYKYKAHKFINYIFYIIVFLVGFLIGFSTEKINFNKLISQVLMIDNVSAAIIDNYNTFDEEFIYNSFTLNSEFDINEYPYIGCKYYNLSSYPTLYCFALNKDDLEKATYTTGSTGGLRNVTINGLSGYYYFNYRISNSSYVNRSTYNTSTSLTGVYTQEGNIHSWIRTNFDFPGITSSSYMAKNVLDFSEYMTKYDAQINTWNGYGYDYYTNQLGIIDMRKDTYILNSHTCPNDGEFVSGYTGDTNDICYWSYNDIFC